MSYALAGFCAVNCWVISKLWETVRARRRMTPPTPPRGGTVVRMPRAELTSPHPPMLMAA